MIQVTVAYHVMAFCSGDILNIMPKGKNFEYYHPLEITRYTLQVKQQYSVLIPYLFPSKVSAYHIQNFIE